EYSDDATKRASTKAFMTGHSQVEKQREKQTTCLYVPLTGHQAVYGVLQVTFPGLVEIPKEKFKFFSRFSAIAGQAFENSSLYQTSHHLVTDLKLINNIAHKLNSNLKTSEI